MQDGDNRFSTYEVMMLYCGICKSEVTRFSAIQYKNGNNTAINKLSIYNASKQPNTAKITAMIPFQIHHTKPNKYG